MPFLIAIQAWLHKQEVQDKSELLAYLNRVDGRDYYNPRHVPTLISEVIISHVGMVDVITPQQPDGSWHILQSWYEGE